MKKSSGFGKKVEAALRRLRPHLSVAYRRAYERLRARGMSQRRPGEPLVCFDLADPAIDAVGGRYYFSLVRDFIDAGYFPVFVAHRGTLASFGVGRVKPLLLGERLGVVDAVADLTEPFLLVTDRAEAEEGQASRVVRVDYARRIAQGPDELPFPVFVHPRLASGPSLPFAYDVEALRPARIFFGGNTEEGKYDRNVIGEVYSMLTRREMLEIAVAEVGEADVHRPREAGEWLASQAPHALVLCETQVCKIPSERWLEALAKGDFFLACPGVGMPLCHNLVEAMAAGSIPILQYARYLTPRLQDGVNCLAFTDADSLRQAVARARAMSPQEVLALRQRVRVYYDEFMAPGRLAGRLLHGDPAPTLVMNSYRVPR